MYTIRHLITDKAIPGTHTITSKATVFDALTLMAEKNVGALVIVDDGEMVGIFSERDYVRNVIRLGECNLETAIGEIMTRSMHVISPEKNLEDAMSMMTQYHIRHLPVVDNGKLIGMASMRDVVAAIISHKDEVIEDLENYIQGKGYPR